jgi:hypothetical protein
MFAAKYKHKIKLPTLVGGLGISGLAICHDTIESRWNEL